VPLRTCVGCRKTDEQAHLVRLVLQASGHIEVDRRRRAHGRGAYVHEAWTCIEKAVHTHGLARSFGRKTQPLDAQRLWSAIGNETKDEGS
jgi:predicted RNA-binding protein YlxR (DUF448 family)